MPRQQKNISINTAELLSRIKKLEEENELLRLPATDNNSVLSQNGNEIETVPVEGMFHTTKTNTVRDIYFLEQTSRIANVGGWEVDLINNTLYWTAVTKKIHEVKGNFQPSLINAIGFYQEGYSRDTINQSVQSAIEKGTSFDVQLQIITALGNLKWVRAKGEAVCNNGKTEKISGTFQDITAEKNTADAYNLLQEKFSKAFNHSALGMAMSNPDTFIFEDVNERFCTILGYTKNELLKMSFRDLTHPGELGDNIKGIQELKEGKTDCFQMEKRCYHKQGNSVWVLAAISALRDENNLATQLIIQIKDINESKAMDEAMNRSEQEYKSLFEHTPSAVFSINPAGFFTKANKLLGANLGYTTEHMLQSNIKDFIMPYHLEKVSVKVAKALQGQPQQTITDVFTATGEIQIISLVMVPIVVDEIITGVYGIANDITEIKKTEQTLCESEDNLRTIFETTEIGYILMNKQLEIISINQPAATFALTEYKKNLLIKTKFLTYFPEERHAELSQQFTDVVAGNKIDYERKFSHTGKNDNWYKIKYSPVVNAQQHVVGIVMSVEDISQQKLATEAINSERNQLRTLIDNLPDTIYIKDAKARKIIANKVDVEIMKASSEAEVIGKTDVEIFPGESGEAAYKDDMQIISTGVSIINKEEDFIDKEGNKHTLLTTKVPLKNKVNQIIGLLGIGRDITLQKRAQEEVKKSNERFEYVTRATFDAIWDWGLITDELYWGEGFKTIFGHEYTNVGNKFTHWNEKVHAEDRERLALRLSDTINSSETKWQDEYRFVKADGSYAIVKDKDVIIKDDNGKSIRMIGAMQDITLQKKEEVQLKLFESVVKKINDAVLITKAEPFDGTGPEIVFVNDAFTKATGYTLADVAGKTPRILQGPGSSRTELDKIKTALKKWEPVEVELINYKKNGEEFWVNISIVPLADENGWYTHWISIQKDITASKMALEEKEVFFELANIINEDDKPEPVLQKTITKIATYLQYDYAEVWSLNFDKTKMTFRGKYANPITLAKEAGRLETLEYVEEKGLAGTALKNKKMLYWENLQQADFLRKESAVAIGVVSGMALPVFFGGEVIAIFSFFCKAPFTERQLNADLLNRISNDLGTAIQKNRTEIELKSFFSLSPDMLCIIGTDGYFKKINPAFTAILGYTEKELLAKPAIQFVHPDDWDKTNNQHQQLLKAEYPAFLENRYITKNEGVKWVAWSFTPVVEEGLIFAVAKDVTYKRKLEEERKQILESISDYFYALDTNFNFTYINSAAQTLLSGSHPGTLAGKNIWQEFPVLRDSSFYTNAKKALETKEPVHFEFYDGINSTWFEESFYPTEDGLSVFFRSVNNRKESEVRLKELNKALEKNAADLANSNSELERFAYVASHDLQEPLRMINGFMQLLQKKYEPQLDDNGKQYIHFAIDGANKMKTLIHDLLQYSRAGAGPQQLEAVDMNEVMGDIKMILKSKIEETNATIHIENLPVINAGIVSINQLMQNLIGNALKYQEAGNLPIVSVSCKQGNGEWVFTVADNGIGIAEGFEEKIFEVFSRLHTKQEYSGTGIGLSICKKIVEKYGGEIWVEAQPAKGTAFKFNIPF